MYTSVNRLSLSHTVAIANLAPKLVRVLSHGRTVQFLIVSDARTDVGLWPTTSTFHSGCNRDRRDVLMFMFGHCESLISGSGAILAEDGGRERGSWSPHGSKVFMHKAA
jgi:hypothetical protein